MRFLEFMDIALSMLSYSNFDMSMFYVSFVLNNVESGESLVRHYFPLLSKLSKPYKTFTLCYALCLTFI